MHVEPKAVEGFQFGRAGRTGGWCCGKPQGCSIQNECCLYLQHPWKRQSRGEITIAERDRILSKQGGSR